jgi:hypothetical protein
MGSITFHRSAAHWLCTSVTQCHAVAYAYILFGGVHVALQVVVINSL